MSSAKEDVLSAYLSQIMKTKLNCLSSGIPFTQLNTIIAMGTHSRWSCNK